jgi:hypothetical protein
MWVRDIYFVEDFAFRTYMVVDPVIRSISDVYHNEDITVANGTALVDVGLPTKVGVNLSDGDSTYLDVIWDDGTPVYDSTTAGTYTFTGTLALPPGIVNPTNLTASVKVIVSPPPLTVTSVSAIADINVAYGTALDEVELPATVSVTLSDSSSATLDVTWDDGNPVYDSTTAGTYTFTGILTLPPGIVNPSSLTASVKVIVAAAPEPPTWPAGSTLTAKNTTKTSTTLTWTAAADDQGVTNYRIFQDSLLIKTVPATVYSYKVTGLSPSTTYTFQIQAGDVDDNWSDGPAVTVRTGSSGGSGSGGGSRSGNKPDAEVQLLDSTGKIAERLTLRLDNSTKSAAVKVDTASLTKAFEGSTANARRIKTVTLNIPAVNGAKAYEVTLPTSFLSSADNSKAVAINTGIASVTLPGNMLTTADAADAQSISLTIAVGDKSKLGEAVRAQIGDRPVIQLSMQINGQQRPWSNAGAPVTVTLPYLPTAEELADPEHITVWYIDGAGNVIAVPSGRYDPQTGLVTFSTTHFSYYAVVHVQKVFYDLGGVEWAKKPIEVLASKGILRGTAENEYSPHESITRADFLYFLIRTLGIDAAVDGNFDDVSSDAYYYKEIGIAKQLGITSGIGNNKFGVSLSITRQDMMVLTEKALRLSNKLNQAGAATDLDTFVDKDQIAPYAINSAAAMVKEGLITGYDGKINPRGNTTRAEAAVLLYRIYNR